ncbi:hypothetical protein ACFS07_33080 [Undibacterium arcticum]
MSLPLFGLSDVDFLIARDAQPEVVEYVVEAEPLQPEAEERIEWTDSAAAEMHSVVLRGSLKRLGAANNAEEKRDILDWIFHSDVPDEVDRIIDGKKGSGS